MTDEPKIERKRSRKWMGSRITAELARAEVLRRELHTLEQELVNQGYADKYARVEVGRKSNVIWTKGKLHLNGKNVDAMRSHSLLMISEVVPQVLDELERGQRWVIQQLEDAVAELHTIIAKVRSEPIAPPQEEIDDREDAEP